MTAAANITPLSVDYTGRDYYALREELIARVKERTAQQWHGTDENDFGLALIEAFAYMGDLLNYYIDRVANESYILTATQRESIINLASMYGYRPANYVSAIVDVTVSNNEGYEGQVGAITIEDGILTSLPSNNYLKVIVPSDHPFSAITSPRTVGAFDYALLTSFPDTVDVPEGGIDVTYDTSMFNGTYPISFVGYLNGGNVLWFRPSDTITSLVDYHTIESGVPLGTQFLVTLSGDGTLIPKNGQRVYINGVDSTGDGYNGNWNITLSETLDPYQFLVQQDDNIATIRKSNVQGTDLVYSSWNNLIVGQNISITGVISSTNTGGTAGDGYNFTSVSPATITEVKNQFASIFGVLGNGTSVVFDSSVLFEVNDLVSIYGVASVGNSGATAGSGYNFQDAVVTAATTTDVYISNIKPDDGNGEITITTTTSHSLEIGDYVTISGVTPTAYNMDAVRIIDRPTTTTFIVEGYVTEPVNSASYGPAKVSTYTFTVTSTEVANTTNSYASALCRQFTVAKGARSPGTYTSGGTVTPLMGGTATVTSGTVVYSNIPPIALSGGSLATSARAINLGETVLPEGTQVTTQVTVEGGVKDVIFSTLSDVTVPFKGSSKVVAVQGEEVSLRTENAANTTAIAYDIPGELIGYSTGRSNQSFALTEIQVAPRSVRVFVDSGIEWEEWSQVEHVQDYSPSSKVFQVDVSASGAVYVTFGDGVSGAIPATEGGIKSQYISGGGTIGNVGDSTLATIGIIPGATTQFEEKVRSYITVINETPATGGADPESNDSIRYNAPRSLRSLNRAVTLEDFSNLALSVDGISKANAIAESRSSVTVYVAPVSGDNSGEEVPGYYGDILDYTDVTEQLTQNMAVVREYLADKVQIGTSVTVLPPVYTGIGIEVSYSYLPQYSPTIIETAIKRAILGDFSYNNVDFQDAITPEEVEFKLRQVDGVSNVHVTDLYRTGGSGRNSLIGFPDEIFIFTEAGITLTALSSEARIASASFTGFENSGGTGIGGSATLVPAFSKSVYSYTVTVPATTATLNVGSGLEDSDGSITINDKEGTTYLDLPVPPLIVITGTAPDGVTIKSYKFKVNIAP